jgi:hypothetical protein
LSLSRCEEMTCPVCGHTQTCEVWSSVNIGLDPELKDRVLRREINKFQCEKCNRGFPIAQSLLYHDMPKRLMILLGYPDKNGDVDPGPVPSQTPLGSVMTGYRYRLVSTENQLIEKILGFDDDLDDRVLEMLKLYVAGKNEDSPLASASQILYDHRTIEDGSECLRFVFFDDSGDGGSFTVPWDDGYEWMLTISKPILDALPPDTDWLQVDQRMGLDLLNKVGEAAGAP